MKMDYINFSTTENTELTEKEESSSLTGKIIGAAIEIHRALGPGLLWISLWNLPNLWIATQKIKSRTPKIDASILQRCNRLLSKFHLVAKIALFSIFFVKFFDHVFTHALKIFQKTCVKTANFFNQSEFRKKSNAVKIRSRAPLSFQSPKYLWTWTSGFFHRALPHLFRFFRLFLRVHRCLQLLNAQK